MTDIVSTRPPLNVFQAVRANIVNTVETKLLYVPKYIIPANGIDPVSEILTAAIMTGLIISNTSDSAATVTVKIKSNGVFYTVIDSMTVPPHDFASVNLDRQVMVSGEEMYVTALAGTVAVHLTYILNQRESDGV